MNRNIKLFRLKPFWHRQPLRLRRKLQIKDSLASIAMKMTMLGHIRAKMSSPAIQSYLSHQPALYQGIQAVINRSHRDFRHAGLGPNKHLFRCGMIPLIQQHGIHVVALRRESKTATSQAIIQVAGRFSCRSHR
jgi:hypothetical protein